MPRKTTTTEVCPCEYWWISASIRTYRCEQLVHKIKLDKPRTKEAEQLRKRITKFLLKEARKENLTLSEEELSNKVFQEEQTAVVSFSRQLHTLHPSVLTSTG